MISDEALMGYLDGHVDAARTREIETALSADADLRARLAALQGNDANLRSAFDALLDDRVPDRLVAAVRGSRPGPIATDPGNVIALKPGARAAGVEGRFGSAIRTVRRALRATPPWVGMAAAAQIALLVAAAVVFQGPVTMTPQPVASRYDALGAAPETPAINAMVVFRPETPERELRAALRTVDARVVGGPTPADAWLLHVPADRSTALARLRARSDILMAQPIDSPEGSK